MKKLVLILLTFIVCAIQPSMAYDYFTIYFTDGTKSDRFYYADVDSICYSKIDIDGIEYEQWQTQEIWIKGNTYRYPISLIDNISFIKVDIDRVANDIANVNNAITPLFIECNSVDELYNQIKALPDMGNVEDVWIDGQRVMVRIKDCIPISFFYPISGEVYENQNFTSRSYPNSRTRSIDNAMVEHNLLTAKKACIINQQYYDEEREDRREISEQLHDNLELMGIDCKLNNKPLPHFFSNEMFEYDIVFIITHGYFYEGKHWLLTGDEYYCYNSDEAKLDWNKSTKLLQTLKDHINNRNYKDSRLTWIKEVRDNQISAVFYLEISEDFISRAPSAHFNNKAIVFNAACESFENDNMWNLFEKKGAGCYLGYHDSNCLGQEAGKNYIEGLLRGKSTYSSYKSVPNNMLEEHFYKYKGENKWYDKDDPTKIKVGEHHAILKMMPEKESICIFHPHTESAIDRSSDGKIEFLLEGNIKYLMSLSSIDMQDKTQFGFQWSLNSDMSQCEKRETKMTQYKDKDLLMNWEMSLGGDDLQPNTTYYYRAYMNDGYSNCYGEIKSFTTPVKESGDDISKYKAYYTYNGDNTITLYYDDLWDVRQHITYMIIDGNFNVESWITKVIIDPSFVNYNPESTERWFRNCKKLECIENLQYLNTSKVKSMFLMFYDCCSLKNLDLSSFNTSNVESMDHMFDGCSSIETLDLKGFDTSKVKGMRAMFSGCSSLLSLDISNFNTSNVVGMEYMFAGCSSLTDLNLSNFDTSNVTDMRAMFGGCNSLINLDFRNIYLTDRNGMELFDGLIALKTINLSNASTINATDMHNMFAGCSSLLSIDLSSFNTANVTNMTDMFAGCSSLTVLDLSSFDTSKASNFSVWDGWGINGMFQNCSSLKTIYANEWCNNGTYICFEGCDNLVGGKGTKIGQNLYGYDKDGNPLYYYCSDGISAAHIDGGKDNPGLFTAK